MDEELNDDDSCNWQDRPSGGDLGAETMDEEDEGPMFTCRDCGSHDLRVTSTYRQCTEWDEWIVCQCRARRGELAILQHYERWASIQETGLLDSDHRWTADDKECDDEDSELTAEETYCERCAARAQPEDWQESDSWSITVTEDPASFEVTVVCEGCQREIEFGWSHPDRGGRIWPAECSDFNPWKCWPEPRFRASWRKKRWLRPDLDWGDAPAPNLP